VLAPHVPAAALDGLAEFSHCWVLYVFHANTDLETRLGAASAQHTAPGKVHVPRLNGAKRGVLATRSPHRPCPVGLSVAQVLAVDDRAITLGGLDVVDGSPVLDIKPYLPFCDAVVGATAPHWAQVRAGRVDARDNASEWLTTTPLNVYFPG
jgi:tRNA (adenine37-N6)-methyltransferase